MLTSAAGTPVRPDLLTRRFVALTASAGLPSIGMHGLRHTHASHLLAAGINPRVVSERLGHASVAFTLDVDAHVMPGQQSHAAQVVAALVDSVTNL